jgi:hypothetical protein
MAEVSGPASQSKRTDLGVLKQSTKPIQATQPMQSYTGGAYGNNKSMAMQQAAAPLAGNPMPEMPPMVGLDAPTQFADEPLSYGANYGEGPGLDTSHLQGMSALSPASVIYKLMQFDTTGKYEALYNKLNMS